MAILTSGSTISEAWLSALEALTERDGVAVNLCVAIADPCREDLGVRHVLDSFLQSQSGGQRTVTTVANTVFPQSLYRGVGTEARERLYLSYTDRAYPVLQRHRENKFGTYFYRLIAYPQGQEPINQLERVVLRLRAQLANRQGLSSIYELGISTGEDEGCELRIQCPGKDTRTRGFPCLSHISLTLEGGRLHLTATYRNQYFISRAYGNYLGLSRLLAFLCKETGCMPGEILVVATHADAEFKAQGIGKRKVLYLLGKCRAISRDGSTWMEAESPKQEQMNGRARGKRQPITTR